MRLRRELSMLRQWSRRVAAATILAGVTALALSLAAPSTYESTATLAVGRSIMSADPTYGELLAFEQLPQTYALVATSSSVLERVVRGLGLDVPVDSLRRRLWTQTSPGSSLLQVTVRDSEPDRAAAIANAIVSELASKASGRVRADDVVPPQVDEELRALQTEITALEAELASLRVVGSGAAADLDRQDAERRLVGLRSAYGALLPFVSDSSASLTLVEAAASGSAPVEPRPLLTTAVATVVGLLVALGLVFLAEHLDDRLQSPDEVQSELGVPTLGVVSRLRGHLRTGARPLPTVAAPRSRAAETYRTIRWNIQFADVPADRAVLLTTSSIPGEGKTTTAANLGVAFAAGGRRTLLLDADVRRPALHKVFDLPNEAGLTSLFSPAVDLPIDRLVQSAGQEGLDVLTSGPLPPDPMRLLGSDRFRSVVAELRHRYSLVLIDSPPLQAVPDAAILSTLVDGTLLVVDGRRTPRGAVVRGLEALVSGGARVIGVILNGAREPAPMMAPSWFGGEHGHRWAPPVIGALVPAVARRIGRRLDGE